MGLTVRLDRKLDYRALGPLLDQLRPEIGQDIVLDATDTEAIGAPALQIILATAKSCRRHGFSLTLTAVRDELADQLQHLGLSVSAIEAGGSPLEKAWA